MSALVRELLTVNVLDEEHAEALSWSEEPFTLEERYRRERALLETLPEGFEIERTHIRGARGPRGFELRLVDCRFSPRRPVGNVSRRFIGRPLVTWDRAARLSDLETAAAFAVVLQLAAVE